MLIMGRKRSEVKVEEKERILKIHVIDDLYITLIVYERETHRFYTKNWILTLDPSGLLVFEKMDFRNDWRRLSKDEKVFLIQFEGLLRVYGYTEKEIKNFEFTNRKFKWYMSTTL
jgi:hypothetical protein